MGESRQTGRDTPQSVTIFSEKLMSDRNQDDVRDVLRCTAGIAFQTAETEKTPFVCAAIHWARPAISTSMASRTLPCTSATRSTLGRPRLRAGGDPETQPTTVAGQPADCALAKRSAGSAAAWGSLLFWQPCHAKFCSCCSTATAEPPTSGYAALFCAPYFSLNRTTTRAANCSSPSPAASPG